MRAHRAGAVSPGNSDGPSPRGRASGTASGGVSTARVGVAVLVFLLAGGTGLSAQALPAEIADELERRASALVEAEPIPGLALGVVVGTRLAYAGGFGRVDRETATPVTPATLFQIGSVTKPLTSTLAAILVERGTVRWDDRLSDHLWEPDAAPDASLTLRQLAVHTSGLPGDPPTLRRRHDDYPVLAFTHVELYASLRRSELAFEPGTAWAYSNFGYALLGHALERATGRPYESLLREELLEPLGMRSTTVTLWPELGDRLAVPHYWDEEARRLTRYTPWDEEALAPAGGVTSTVEDLARFAAFLFRARRGEEILLGASTLEAVQSVRWRFDDGHGYGTGWFVEDRPGVGRVLYHGGGVDGYSAWIALVPRSELAVILLVNSGAGDPIVDLADWLLDRLSTDPPPS